MEEFVVNQIKLGLKYLPSNLIKSAFIKKTSAETQRLRDKGFIFGVCHPNENFEQIKSAGIRWIRIDIPFPFDKEGNVTESYKNFKNRAASYAERDIKVMAVTPYPSSYTDAGIDIFTDEGENRVREIALFMLNDFRGIVGAYQITNEMGVPRFTVPLTMQQAARFIGIQLEAMFPHKGDALLGYNSAGPQADLHLMLKPYHKYCDYVGIDFYSGCFAEFPGFMFFFDALLAYLWAFTGKPIMLQEFGYISDGAPKTKKEKLDILKGYGFSSEKQAKNDIVRFVANLGDYMREHISHVCQNDASKYFEFVLKGDYKNHVYKELPRITKIPGYPHTPQGQADFFSYIIPHIYDKPYVAGMFIYCYSDCDRCYVCGQSDCPTETRWGLVGCDGQPKPSYYAVQKVSKNLL